jgi:hypothetical protein
MIQMKNRIVCSLKRSDLSSFSFFCYNILARFFYSSLICTKKKEQVTTEKYMHTNTHTHTCIDKNHNREIRKGRRGFIDEFEPDGTSEPSGSPSSSSEWGYCRLLRIDESKPKQYYSIVFVLFF